MVVKWHWSDNDGGVSRAMQVKSCLHYILCLFLVLTSLGYALGSETTNSTATSIAFPDAPINVNDSTLDAALQTYSPFVLECWKEGCRPCQLIRPKVDEMAKELQGLVVFGRIDIMRNAITQNRYQVSRSPTLLIFRNGSLIYKHVGNYPKNTLEAIIKKQLGMS